MAEKPQPAGELLAKVQAFAGPAVSVGLHVGLLATSALWVPRLGETDTRSGLGSEVYLVRVTMGGDVAEREMENQAVFNYGDGPEAASDDGRAVADEKGAEGRAGSPESDVEAGRAAAQGPADNPDPSPEERGRVGSWASAPIGPFTDPVGQRWAPASREAIGDAPIGARGNLKGTVPVDAAGRGGAAPAGDGQGGRAMACVGPGVVSGSAGGPVRYVPKTAGKHGQGGPAVRRTTSAPATSRWYTACDPANAR